MWVICGLYVGYMWVICWLYVGHMWVIRGSYVGHIKNRLNMGCLVVLGEERVGLLDHAYMLGTPSTPIC